LHVKYDRQAQTHLVEAHIDRKLAIKYY